jgi:hypothetical protein
VPLKRVREINQRIRALGIDLGEIGDPSPVECLCECGCMGRVAMTPAEYDEAGGARIEGHSHRPDAASDDA